MAYVQQPTRYYVSAFPMFDSALGRDGGVVCIYTGYVRRHVWKSRSDELLMDGRGMAEMLDGDVYEGDFVLGMFEGLGVMRFQNGDLYDGQWEANLRHGYGVMEYADGRSYAGLFKFGEKSGAGADSGVADSYVGSYKNGLANGPGQLVNTRTNEVIDGLFKDGKMDGLCTITYPNGDCYVGTFRGGVPHGKGRYVMADTGDEYLEEFDNGRCLVGVLEPSENAVIATSFSTTCLEQSLTQAASSLLTKDNWEAETPSLSHRIQQLNVVKRDSRCHERRKATGDEYIGGWLRTEQGTGNRRGLRHGQGTLIIKATGAVYVGAFVDGMMDGEGRMTFPPIVEGREDDPNRMLEYVGGFFKDLFHGKATVLYADGSRKEQFFARGVAHGISHEQVPVEKRSHPNENTSLMYEPSSSKGVAVDYHLRDHESSPTHL